MKITIICVGKLKEKYWKDGILEYTKRLTRYTTQMKIIELPDEKTPDNASIKDEELILEKEGEQILKNIPQDGYVITLAIKGKNLTSEELSKVIENKMITGNSHIVFIIGGSLGLSESVYKKSHMQWSLSNLTFPHQMVRVMLVEQIYRAFRIMKNEPYHK